MDTNEETIGGSEPWISIILDMENRRTHLIAMESTEEAASSEQPEYHPELPRYTWQLTEAGLEGFISWLFIHGIEPQAIPMVLTAIESGMNSRLSQIKQILIERN